MARFFDLEDATGDGDEILPPEDVIRQTLRAKLLGCNVVVQPASQSSPTPPSSTVPSSYSTSIARAFQCYPVVAAVVSNIDLNSLDALARTCRSVHDCLMQYRSGLLTRTLHCVNEEVPIDPEALLRYRARASTGGDYLDYGRNSNGKSGRCARDMVDGCRRCGQVICRNCVIKPHLQEALLQIAVRRRHRRLCRSCVTAPVAALAIPCLDVDLPFSSEFVQQSLCKCQSLGVWFCPPCGRTIRRADLEYQSMWRWRNAYGKVLGGLGTGIGDGDRGVICGRETHCLAAREREYEIDCDAEDARDYGLGPWVIEDPLWTTITTPSGGPALAASGSPAGLPFRPGPPPIAALIEEDLSEGTPSPQLLGPGYERHEIEGIGGRVKRKLVRMVRVGACVPEWNQESGPRTRALGSATRALGPELDGKVRSWCGWCCRVIPGKKDLLDGEGGIPQG